MATEADACRKFIVPALQKVGWDDPPHTIAEQRSFTDGRIVVIGNKVKRRPAKRADFLLRFTRDFTIAVVEAKAAYKNLGDGMQQAKEYAEILGLKFAYSSNGKDGFLEFDYFTGNERQLTEFPSPDELWSRWQEGMNLKEPEKITKLLEPNGNIGKESRYYQEIAINRTIQSILQGKNRILLNMATGTGKTLTAFQICFKLWSARWNRTGEYRRPRILYLADRNILVDDPKDKHFIPFGDARHKIENGEAIKSREMYFAIYQSIAQDVNRPGLYKEYSPDFFDLIIIDEAHRGSARDDSNWREILDYFEPAYKLGMTATPLREDNRDTYKYFGNPLYTYSLKQGIEDGFLAPYRVHRVVSTVDAAGWRPSKGELDRYGREIPDGEYGTKDFERLVALKMRTLAIAKHLTAFMHKTDRYGKTIVFCVDQEHAEEMRHALNNLNTDISQKRPDYVVRITSDEGAIGKGHLGRFQELETVTPVIATTSKLLTTGVDIQTCKNIVLVNVINSMTEFKQIIGRGTRVRDDYGKYFFNILDYTGSATRLFADPEFDGQPALITEEEMNAEGETVETTTEEIPPDDEPPDDEGEFEEGESVELTSEDEPDRRKFYVDGGVVEIATHLVYELDADGKKLDPILYTDYVSGKVRTLYTNAANLRKQWSDPIKREEIIEQLEERGIDFDTLRENAKQPEADPFDLLCHLAFNAPLRTRRERAERLKKDKQGFFETYGPEARTILEALLEKYAEHGLAQFKLPDILKVEPISNHGNVMEIADYFGGLNNLKMALEQLQVLLYAA